MTRVSVQIPGKVMLAGEYSVLYGGRALAATVTHHMDVTAQEYSSGLCHLTSQLWDDEMEIATSVKPDENQPPLVVAALSSMKRHDLSGAKVSIDGDLDPSFGFGSSSALRLGTAIALKSLADGRLADTYWDEAIYAHELQKRTQKQASGYDIVTQYVGGLTLFSPAERATGGSEKWPGPITTFPETVVKRLNQIVHIFVGGKGAPTADTMRSTSAWIQSENLESEIVRLSEDLINAFTSALLGEKSSLSELCAAVQNHRALFAKGPTYPPWLGKAMGDLPLLDQRFSYKITGAGGEDAVLLIGDDRDIEAGAQVLEERGWQRLRSPFRNHGVKVSIDHQVQGMDRQ